MKSILKIGRYFEVNNKGYIENFCHLSLIPKKWIVLVNELMDLYTKSVSDIHSIYIRGSVARGRPIDGSSDIDMVVILNNRSYLTDTNLDMENKEFVKVLINKYPFCTKIDTTLEYDPFDLDIETMFLLKTQSICLYGDNCIPKLQEFKLQDVLRIYYPILSKELPAFLEAACRTFLTQAELRELTRKSMKRLIRVAGIISFQNENRYTPDLYLCYSSFQKRYPQFKNDIKKALEIAVFQNATQAELEYLYNHLGKWILSHMSYLTGV